MFHQFVAAGKRRATTIGYADIAEIRYGSDGRPFTPVEILRAFAATVEHAELHAFRRELLDFDIATATVQAAGGVTNLYGVGGRPHPGAVLPDAATGASPRLRDHLSNRFALDRYFRQAPDRLTATFCDNLAAVTEAAGVPVLLLDTYEEIAELDDWVCQRLVPNLPGETRFVMLGRHQLTKTNIDWIDHQRILDARPLPELSEDEAKSYLRHHGLTDATALHAVFGVTGGYPLLLVLARVLATESGGWATIDELRHDRDRETIARGLLDRILREERAARIREVLETCSIAPWINPGIIGVLLDVPPSTALQLYTELAVHSLVSRHPHGVVLHDKIRELLQVRLRYAGEIQYKDRMTVLANHLAQRGGLTDERQ